MKFRVTIEIDINPIYGASVFTFGEYIEQKLKGELNLLDGIQVLPDPNIFSVSFQEISRLKEMRT